MVARIPFPFLKPAAFFDHADDVALIYRDKLAADAEGEAAWMLHCIGDDSLAPAVRATLARALRMAAMQLEAGDA